MERSFAALYAEAGPSTLSSSDYSPSNESPKAMDTSSSEDSSSPEPMEDQESEKSSTRSLTSDKEVLSVANTVESSPEPMEGLKNDDGIVEFSDEWFRRLKVQLDTFDEMRKNGEIDFGEETDEVNTVEGSPEPMEGLEEEDTTGEHSHEEKNPGFGTKDRISPMELEIPVMKPLEMPENIEDHQFSTSQKASSKDSSTNNTANRTLENETEDRISPMEMEVPVLTPLEMPENIEDHQSSTTPEVSSLDPSTNDPANKRQDDTEKEKIKNPLVPNIQDGCLYRGTVVPKGLKRTWFSNSKSLSLGSSAASDEDEEEEEEEVCDKQSRAEPEAEKKAAIEIGKDHRAENHHSSTTQKASSLYFSINNPADESQNDIEKEEEVKNPHVPNIQNGCLYRGTVVPKGLKRTWFSNYKRLSLGSSAASDEEEEEEEEKGEEVVCHQKSRRKPEEKAAIKIGKDHQAEFEEEPMDSNLKEEEEERDELMWSSLQFGEYNVWNENELEELYNSYWRAIYRQYKGHIPMDYALQNLMKNGFDFVKSLQTIDKTLVKLPQAMKPLCVAQFKSLQKLFKRNWAKKKTRRNVQEKAMKNYHLGEIQEYIYQFGRFYHREQVKHGIPCMCNKPLCQEVVFEPRYACSNCTKDLRKNPIPSDSESVESGKLCLICQTCKMLDASKRIPEMRSVAFNDEELHKIQKWDKKEEELGRKISIEEFESMLLEETMQRWKRYELTEEEESMENFSELGISRAKNGKKPKDLTEEEKTKCGAKVVEQLKPFELPHFTKCNCQKSGKFTFSAEGQKLYVQAYEKHDGDWKKVEKQFKMKDDPTNLVQRFLESNRQKPENFKKCDPSKHLPTTSDPIVILPPSNLPPPLPKISVVSSSNSSTGSKTTASPTPPNSTKRQKNTKENATKRNGTTKKRKT